MGVELNGCSVIMQNAKTGLRLKHWRRVCATPTISQMEVSAFRKCTWVPSSLENVLSSFDDHTLEVSAPTSHTWMWVSPQPPPNLHPATHKCRWVSPPLKNVLSSLKNKTLSSESIAAEMCSERDSPLEPFVFCRLPANLNSRGSSVAPTWAHLCWPGSRSVHGSIHSCVIGRPRFVRRGHPKYCLGCLAWSRRPPSMNES